MSISQDYETRGLILAYRRGDLDEAGIELLKECLEEYGMTINDI